MSKMRKCTYINNDVKVSSESSSSLHLESASLIFTECRFKINEKMKYSLFYYGGNSDVPMKLESCTFYGKLRDDAYFAKDDRQVM